MTDESGGLRWWQRLGRYLRGEDEPQSSASGEPPESARADESETFLSFDPHDLLTETFTHLRRAGLNLGVAELLAAYQAVEGGWGRDDPAEVAAVAKLIWCNSHQDEAEFDLHWERLLPVYTRRPEHTPLAQPPSPPAEPAAERLPFERSSKPPPSTGPASIPVAPAPAFSALPLRAPYVPAPIEGDATIQAYWPLPRRNMIYAWRYLRRPLPDGPADVLDVRATVHRAARQGYYLAPVYRRRERNHAHLILLIDQGGSMAPLHRFTRDLVETVMNESTLEAVETYYFHNVPVDSYYADPHLTVRIPAREVLASCDGETSVLIVSDGGAARGVRSLPRMQATARFLAELKAHTTLLAWLNPLPAARWPGSTAQYIGGMVEMFAMDPDGLAGAIDVLRGQ
jgi:uncharacterized protein with von Willebrand factor type A (vWA) domain